MSEKASEKEEAIQLNTEIQLTSNIDDLLEKKKEEMKKEEEEKQQRMQKRKEMEAEAEKGRFYNEEYIKLIDQLEEGLIKLKPGESRLYEYGDRLVQCWKCNQLNLIKANWEVIECSYCRHLCKFEPEINHQRVPHPSNVLKSPSSPDPLSTKTVVPCIFTVLICPFCRAQNKQLASEEELKCFVCNKVCSILKPEKKPKEEDCYSFDPNNRYYKFNHKKDPVYPPLNAYGVSDLFFPDPVMHEMPINPIVNYMTAYYNLQAIHQQKRIEREKERKGIEYQYGNKDRRYLVAKLRDIDVKVTTAIESIQNEKRFRESQALSQSQAISNRVNSYQKTFFMKK